MIVRVRLRVRVMMVILCFFVLLDMAVVMVAMVKCVWVREFGFC